MYEKLHSGWRDIYDSFSVQPGSFPQLIDNMGFKCSSSGKDFRNCGNSSRRYLRFSLGRDTKSFSFSVNISIEHPVVDDKFFNLYFGAQGQNDIRCLSLFENTASLLQGTSLEAIYYSKEFRLTFVFFERKLHILINNSPVYCRFFSNFSPEYVSFDTNILENVPLTIYNLELEAIADKQSSQFAERYKDILARRIQKYLDLNDFDRVAISLHAFEGVINELPLSLLEEIFEKNFGASGPFRKHLCDLVLSKLPSRLANRWLSQFSSPKLSPIVSVDNLTVSLPINPSMNSPFMRSSSRGKDEKILLNDLSFNAYQGDVVGILGKNGAGKSTLLKSLVSAMPISDGRICAKSKPFLLRPGAGMHGDLTGRENIIKTSLYLGYLPKEINALVDDIIDFSELSEHIDRPFKYYSDGMKSRLIFSLATAIPRDILMLDELLSAGDLSFQKKAMRRLEEYINQASVVFVVQHTFDFILSKCTKCLVLVDGAQEYFGDPSIATEIYKASL